MHDDRWEVKDFNLVKRNPYPELVDDGMIIKDCIWWYIGSVENVYYHLQYWYYNTYNIAETEYK